MLLIFKVLKQKYTQQKHHFQDEKYKEKTKRQIKNS